MLKLINLASMNKLSIKIFATIAPDATALLVYSSVWRCLICKEHRIDTALLVVIFSLYNKISRYGAMDQYRRVHTAVLEN